VREAGGTLTSRTDGGDAVGAAPLIEIIGLEKRYAPVRRGAPPTLALAGIELAVADGEFVSVVGPSGCGKSTLLHIMAGLERPSAGSVRLAGREVVGPGPERAVVFQTPALYPWLNVRDNIAFGLYLRDGRRLERHRVDHFIDRVGLTGFDRHRPYQLSGGMQQRAAIARALITEPRVLLMDEPFGALDAQTRNDMQAFLLDLWQSVRSTVVFVTHDVEEAVLLGDRVVVISHRPGRVAATVAVPLPRPRTWESTLGPEFTALRRTILALLRGQGRAREG
jgi:NitT/TauT family transport system ATP-binding protein